MSKKHISGFTIAGLTVRTKNSDEFNPSTAKIAPLWGKVIETGALNLIPHQPLARTVYGVYSGFESDASGEYDLTVGALVTKSGPDYHSIDVAAGNYQVFEARGEMPEALIKTWQIIWAHFEARPEQQRSYKTDFEHYCGEQAVDVYIGVEEEEAASL